MSCIVRQQTNKWNYASTNQQNFDNPQTLAPQISTIPVYLSFIKVTAKNPFFAFRQIQNGARLCKVKEGEIRWGRFNSFTVFKKATSKNKFLGKQHFSAETMLGHFYGK